MSRKLSTTEEFEPIQSASLRRRVHEVLEVGQSGDWTSQAVDIFLMLLITGNVAALVISTDENIHSAAPEFFLWFEVASLGVFVIEYGLRVWSCVTDERYSHPVRGRLRFVMHPLMLADAIALLSFLFLFPVTPAGGVNLVVFRALRLVGRLARLGRYSPGLRDLGLAIAMRRNEMLAVVSVVGALLVLASSLMFYLEHQAQPESFSSIPASMWWSIITVTTVGYGDVAPMTPMGRLLAGVIALLGIGIFALPAGILGSGFMEQVNQRRSRPVVRVCPHCGLDIDQSPERGQDGVAG